MVRHALFAVTLWGVAVSDGFVMRWVCVSGGGGAVSECVLAAGDAGDISEMLDWLGQLSNHAYGQVLIEVSTESQIVPLALPAGIGVTWLPCSFNRP